MPQESNTTEPIASESTNLQQVGLKRKRVEESITLAESKDETPQPKATTPNEPIGKSSIDKTEQEIESERVANKFITSFNENVHKNWNLNGLNGCNFTVHYNEPKVPGPTNI